MLTSFNNEGVSCGWLVYGSTRRIKQSSATSNRGTMWDLHQINLKLSQQRVYSFVLLVSVYLGRRLHSSVWRHVTAAAATAGAKETSTEGHVTSQSKLASWSVNIAIMRLPWQHDDRGLVTRKIASINSPLNLNCTAVFEATYTQWFYSSNSVKGRGMGRDSSTVYFEPAAGV